MILREEGDYWSKTDFDKDKIRKDIKSGKRIWTTLNFIARDDYTIEKSIEKIDRLMDVVYSNYRVDFSINSDKDNFLVENCFGEKSTIASLSEMIYEENRHCSDQILWYRWVELRADSSPKAYIVLGNIKVPVVMIRPNLYRSSLYKIGNRSFFFDGDAFHIFKLRIQEDFVSNKLRKTFLEYGTTKGLV
jgi:hypothetical protein